MPTRKDKDGRWHAEVCVGGKRLHRRLPEGATARDAKHAAAQLTKALEAQKQPKQIHIPGDPLLNDLLGDYTERHALTLRSPDTARFHAYRAGQWTTGHRASETREVVAEMTEALLEQYAPATVNRTLGALKKALSTAWLKGRTSTDYSTLIKRLPENNDRTTYLSVEQVGAIAAHASANVRAAVWIALLTGCRRGEVCKIRREHIADDHIELPAGNTKTLKYRRIPIAGPLRPWLPYLPLQINYEGIKSGFRRAREKAGMPHVHFHDLRHSCATILLGLGEPLHVIRDILGHTSIKSTERYSHAMVEPQRAALEKILVPAPDYTETLHRKQKSNHTRNRKGAASA